MEQNYLTHYGVPGMKWGVRRYQNEDGSYKSGAKGRYSDNGLVSKIKRSASADKVLRQKNAANLRQYNAEMKSNKKAYKTGTISKNDMQKNQQKILSDYIKRDTPVKKEWTKNQSYSAIAARTVGKMAVSGLAYGAGAVLTSQGHYVAGAILESAGMNAAAYALGSGLGSSAALYINKKYGN